MSFSQLNPRQQEAVISIDGPLLLVAGAGTGKTTVITEKIAYLLEEKKVPSSEILALTFTDKAAHEMRERVDERVNTAYLEIQISTFHAFAQKLLEDHGLDLGLPNRFQVYTETDSWLLLRRHIYDLKLDYYRPLGSPSRHIHELLRHFSKCKDELISPEMYLEYAENLILDQDVQLTEEKTRLLELAHAYHEYNRLLLAQGALDFADLLYYAVKLVQTRPGILQKLQQQFRYILVDEFQDVNFAQYEFIKLLSANSHLTVVGDDDQSIYAFRGANVGNILRFQEDFPGTKNVVLNENYRSTQAILDTAYKSIQHNNPERLEVKLGLDKRLIAKKEGSATPTTSVVHIQRDTVQQEIQAVVNEILRLKNEDPQRAWDDFAILIRANSHSEAIGEALYRAKIPYEFLASSGLFREQVVMDAINFFKILHHPHDDSAWYRLLRLSFFHLTGEEVQSVLFLAKKKSLSYYEVLSRGAELQLSPNLLAFADKALSLVHQGLALAKTEKPSTVLYHFFEKSGYFAYLLRGENDGDNTLTRSTFQLKQFFDFVSEYETLTPGTYVAQFLEHISYLNDAGDEGALAQFEDTSGSVNILTVHAAKGLEFRFVFVVHLVEDRFPARRRGEGISLPDQFIRENISPGDFHFQEERRLFYVAITRAKERLYLTSASDYGGVRQKKISRFLDELGYTTNIGGQTKEKSGEALRLFAETDTPPSDKIEYDIPTVFSYSQLGTYESCPYKYKLAHIIKIPSRGNASTSFGSSIHNTLQKFYQLVQSRNSSAQPSLFESKTQTTSPSDSIKVPSLNELLDLYDECWISDWYESKKQRENYYDQGKEMLRVFYAVNDGRWTIPLSLESSFKIKIGDAIIRGRIDRIDKLADGSLEVIDYKTGEPKETLETKDKDQLLIYQIATEMLPEYKFVGQTSKLTFYFLRGDVKTSFVGNNKDLERVRAKIEKTVLNIQSRQFTATPGPFVCKHCDFRDMCEFRVL